MSQSAQARSSSVPCSSVELACEHQQFNQTSKRTCIGDATDEAPETDVAPETAEAPETDEAPETAEAPETDARFAAACRLVVLIGAYVARRPLKGVSAGHVRHEFCWAVESITCMSPGTHCHAQPTLLSFTRPSHWKTSRSHGSGCPDLIQVLRDVKMDLIQ